MRFFASDGKELEADEVVQSGSVSDPEHGGIGGYEPENAIFRDGIWGGRRESYGDPPGPFYLGAKFLRPVEVGWVKWMQECGDIPEIDGFLVPPTHTAPFCKMTVEVECDGVWQCVSHRVAKPEDIGRQPTRVPSAAPGAPPFRGGGRGGQRRRREPEATEWHSEDRAPRTSCRFGEECRNRRPKHRHQFAHPGDPDYSGAPTRDAAEEEEVRKVFGKWDSDSSGTLERKEMLTILELLGLSPAEAETIFSKVDKNGNDQVEVDEFISWIFGREDSQEFLRRSWLGAEAATTRGWSLTLVPESRELEKIREVMHVTDRKNLGHGKDVKEKGAKYTDLEVVHAWKVNKPMKTQRFALTKDEVATQLRMIATVKGPRDPTVTKLSRHEGFFQVDNASNEKILLHGTNPHAIVAILQNGLDSRMSGGMFGAGVYLAEDPSKIDQYCTPDNGDEDLAELWKPMYEENAIKHPGGEIFYCFVVRALMGCPVHTEDGEVDIENGEDIWWSDECRQLSHVPGVVPPLHYHALVAETGEGHARHREFVHFDGTGCCLIQYVIAYRRVYA